MGRHGASFVPGAGDKVLYGDLAVLGCLGLEPHVPDVPMKSYMVDDKWLSPEVLHNVVLNVGATVVLDWLPPVEYRHAGTPPSSQLT